MNISRARIDSTHVCLTLQGVIKTWTPDRMCGRRLSVKDSKVDDCRNVILNYQPSTSAQVFLQHPLCPCLLW